MNRPEYLRLLQRYVANVGISGSALRNQGASGIIEAARTFLAELDLAPLPQLAFPEYRAWLDSRTDVLLATFPEGAKNWGAARKAMNIFMAHSFFNRELCAEYSLERFEGEMETPLDFLAATKLYREAGRGKLPKWTSIRSLTPEVSDKYQAFALEHATKHGISRACLDVLLWRPNDSGEL